MGKGFNNFMSKKAFHPGSYANQKRVQEAEARAEAKRKHDEETLAQYQKEQELFNQKNLVSKESKDKLSLSFMYEVPAGISKEEDKNRDKIEWKGSNLGKSKAITSEASTSKGQAPSICLEWKREKPARIAAKTESNNIDDGNKIKVKAEKDSHDPERKRIKKER